VTDDDLQRRVERLADRLESAGHTVSLDDATDAAGCAALLGITVRWLSERRSAGTAPPHLQDGAKVLYPLAEYLRWRDAQVIGRVSAAEPAKSELAGTGDELAGSRTPVPGWAGGVTITRRKATPETR
jgi:hypothetical protein